MGFHAKRGLRQKIKNGDLILSMFSRTGCGDIIEMAGYRGMDVVLIDQEHGPADGSDVRDLVRAAECAGIFPIVRPSTNEPSLILRALDVGAIGVMVPHVRNRAEAEQAVRSVKYRPAGERGTCHIVRATEFESVLDTDARVADWDEYRRVANEETVVIVLIEDEEGLRNIEDIATVPGIDVLFVGPGDYAEQIGVGQTGNDPRVREAVLKGIEVARRHGLAPWVSLGRSNPDKLAYWYDQGCRIFHFTDITLFSEAVTHAVTTARATARDRANAVPVGVGARGKGG